ncbi:MAG: prepilin-type N-terminal cleavage/methylation domain-containing protein [Candidatus Riflebacteria bacterium]|nr:prepilin-type N-terminal cleavage/methylation domain-containing protein [Candidatus Riflebacteria bacterium]
MNRKAVKAVGSKRHRKKSHAFTIVELLIVLTLICIILAIAYKVFFSQARMVARSMEFMKVNDSLRRIIVYLGNDIREATNIVSPKPIDVKNIQDQKTPEAGGEVLHIIKQEIDPSVKFGSGGSSNWTAAGTSDQVVRVRDISYSLRWYRDPAAKTVPRIKLIRTEYVEERAEPGVKLKQVVELTDTLREFTVFRTLRQPMNKRTEALSKKEDRLLTPVPLADAGTGNDLVYFRITLQSPRLNEQTEAYDITVNTSFCKRGKEVFQHQ